METRNLRIRPTRHEYRKVVAPWKTNSFREPASRRFSLRRRPGISNSALSWQLVTRTVWFLRPVRVNREVNYDMTWWRRGVYLFLFPVQEQRPLWKPFQPAQRRYWISLPRIRFGALLAWAAKRNSVRNNWELSHPIKSVSLCCDHDMQKTCDPLSLGCLSTQSTSFMTYHHKKKPIKKSLTS